MISTSLGANGKIFFCRQRSGKRLITEAIRDANRTDIQVMTGFGGVRGVLEGYQSADRPWPESVLRTNLGAAISTEKGWITCRWNYI